MLGLSSGVGVSLMQYRRLARTWPSAVLVVAVLVTATTTLASGAVSARSHSFTARYAGHGSGQVSGNSASGSATATGRGNLIGRGTLYGSASGIVTSKTCVTFSGTAVLKGSSGSITLAARHAHACANGTDANDVLFSGSATITGGSAAFAGARGTLLFTGTYLRPSGSVTITFRGRVSY
jgi:hypothetical protein